jgi:hypothetical protein
MRCYGIFAVPPAAPAFKATFKTSKPHHDGAHPQPELGLSLLVKNLLRISANALIDCSQGARAWPSLTCSIAGYVSCKNGDLAKLGVRIPSRRKPAQAAGFKI